MTKYCPILMIGFAPPKAGEKDNRTCKTDCAWYNTLEKKCAVNYIASNLSDVASMVEEIGVIGAIGAGYEFEELDDRE